MPDTRLHSEVLLRVSDMTCPSYELGVREGLLEEPGVLDVSADWQEGTARVAYDSQLTSPERLLRASVFNAPSPSGRHRWRAQIGVEARRDCCV